VKPRARELRLPRAAPRAARCNSRNAIIRNVRSTVTIIVTAVIVRIPAAGAAARRAAWSADNRSAMLAAAAAKRDAVRLGSAQSRGAVIRTGFCWLGTCDGEVASEEEAEECGAERARENRGWDQDRGVHPLRQDWRGTNVFSPPVLTRSGVDEASQSD
jgi:hypothetical protein